MRGSKAILCLACGIAACGKTTNLTDAPAGDANNADAGNTIDADAHGAVTVTVMNPDGVSGPMAGVKVAFIEPNGDLAGEPMTDVNGKASASVLPGASVTAVYVLSPTSHQIESITGVKPGDDLVIGTQHPDTTAAGTFTVNVIAVVGTLQYDVYGPCGSGTYVVPAALRGPRPLGVVATVPVTLTMTADCVQSTMDLVATRMDTTSTVVDYVELPNVAFTDGGMTTQVDPWTALATMTANYTNVPADINFVYPTERVPDSFGSGYFGYIAPASGVAMSTWGMPLAKTAYFSTLITATDHTGTQDVYAIADGTKTSYGFDVGLTLLPWLDTPTIDLATAKITTPNAGGGGSGDAFVVNYRFERPDPSSGGSGSGAINDVYTWRVWSPTVGDVTLPKLPTDLADNNPTATDTDDGGDARLFDLDLATGYDAVRAHLDSGYDAYLASGRGALGTLRTSWSSGQPGFTGLFRAARR